MTYAPNLTDLTDARIERGSETILNRVSLGLAAGSVTVMTGPNGSGKTTLLAVLAGLHPLAEGELRVASHVRRALVPQRSEAVDSLPLTVADVVSMGRWFTPRRRNRQEDRVIVAESVHAVGLRGLEDRRLGDLSGGQRQRALLGQGLAQRADVLLLDEPTAGLDDDGIRMLRASVVAERERGAAVVVVSHDAISVGATRRIRIDSGTVHHLSATIPLTKENDRA